MVNDRNENVLNEILSREFDKEKKGRITLFLEKKGIGRTVWNFISTQIFKGV